MLTSKHVAYNHFTPKEKVQRENGLVTSIYELHHVGLIISHAYLAHRFELHSDATLVDDYHKSANVYLFIKQFTEVFS